MHLDDIADKVHEGKHAYGEESHGIEGQEWSDNEFLGADVFQQTEYAVDSYNELQEGHPGELLGIVALGLLLGAAALGRTYKTALASDNGGEYGTGVAYRNAYAKGHQDG